MANTIYLGRVKWIHERHATLEPLVKSCDKGVDWETRIDNVTEEFPSRGCVHWYAHPRELKEGDLLQFDVKLQPYYDESPDRDKYEVLTHKWATEVIDIRDVGSERGIRSLLANQGVPLDITPMGNRCILRIQGEKWVGPIHLVRRNRTSSWVFAPEQDLKSIRCWGIPQEQIQKVEWEGTRYLLPPKHEKPGRHIGFISWEANEVLAKQVLNKLLKQDRKTAEALNITKEVFKKYIETIERAGLLDQELTYCERIREILDVILVNEELLDEAARACFAMSPVKKKMEEKATEEYQKILDGSEARLNKDLAVKREELSALIRTLSDKEKELSSADKRNQALDAKLDKRVSEFDSELETKLRGLSEKPEKFFAEMAVAKALISHASPNLNKPRVPAKKHIGSVDMSIPIIEESKKFIGDLSKRFLDSQISPSVGYTLHSVLLAGLVPVLIGPEAYEAVSLYADCVSGGVFHWIPVGGSLFEPSDLLAKFDPNSRCLIPHPGGLIDLLLDESDNVHVVVLEGFNRAAVDGYLIPLLQSRQDLTLGRKPRAIPLAPPGFACEEDAYAGVSSIAWSHNVLLILCPSIGVSTLPVPKELWTFCTVLDLNKSAVACDIRETESSCQAWKVPATAWKAWSNDIINSSKPLDELRKPPQAAGELPSVVLRYAENLYWTGVALGLNTPNALRQVLDTVLYPYLIGAERAVDAWSQHLGIEVSDGDQRISDTMRRLGE